MREIPDVFINENFKELEQKLGIARMQRTNIKPINIKEIREGEIVLSDDGTTRRIVVKIFGNLYYVNLTAL